jgi:hypothetical protein
MVAVMSSEAAAYEAYPTMEDEWNRKRQLSEMQGIEQGVDAASRELPTA